MVEVNMMMRVEVDLMMVAEDENYHLESLVV